MFSLLISMLKKKDHSKKIILYNINLTGETFIFSPVKYCSNPFPCTHMVPTGEKPLFFMHSYFCA